MQHLFADYEVSTLVKDKGFIECCFQYFEHGVLTQSSYSEFIDFNTKYKNNNIISAPLWDQIIEWLRKKHQIDVSVFVTVTHVELPPIQWCAWVVDIKKLILADSTANTEFYSTDYNEARRTAILHALILI